MLSNFDFDVISRSWGYLFREGMTFTLMLTGLAAGIGIVLGTLIAMMRLSPFVPLQKIAAGYVNLLRSLPLVLVIFWFYFLLPYIGQWVTGSERPMTVGAFNSALITFALFEAAYYAEIMRAGVLSVPGGQMAAACALGLSRAAAMRLVVLPQALRIVLPPLASLMISLVKHSAIVSAIAIFDLANEARNVISDTFMTFEIWLTVAGMYLVVTTLLSLGARWLDYRLSRASAA